MKKKILFDEFNNFLIDDESTTTINTDTLNRKTNLFFKENYDHENVTINTTIDEQDISICQIQRRKSLSSCFRSVSKEITYEHFKKTRAFL